MKWDEMSPRERDALVATEVMEWDLRDEFFSDGDYAGALLYNEGECMGSPGEGYRPSTDISAAWEVVEKMREEGYEPALVGDDHGKWALSYSATSGIGPEVKYINVILDDDAPWCDTAPEAICLAALRAKGVDV